MEKQRLLIFGTHPRLSLAELFGVTEAQQNLFEVEDLEFGALVNQSESLDDKFFQSLAGVVKIASVLERRFSDKKVSQAAMTELLLNHLTLRLEGIERANIGFSFYGFAKLLPNRNEQMKIGLTLKKVLREKLGHVRWVNGNGSPLSSVVVQSQLLAPKGVELTIVQTEKEIIVAETTAVQEYEDWGKRDFGRPRRNAKQGMLPPKLAHMMVNMLGLAPHGTLLDPFCGSGTILMEAAVLGWKDCVAADQNAMAVRDTQKNIAWAKDEGFHSATLKTHAKAIRDLSLVVAKNSVAAVVTEPYLGRPLLENVSEPEARERDKEVSPMYQDLFDFLNHALEPHGRAVIVVPAWVLTTGECHLVSIDQLSLGKLKPLPVAEGRALMYERAGQHVSRQLVRFEKG